MAVEALHTKNRIHPTHPNIRHWAFPEEHKDEAKLADAMAELAYNNGLSVNDLQHLFPAVLRMLKSNSDWAK
jgi:hypothetical protein